MNTSTFVFEEIVPTMAGGFRAQPVDTIRLNRNQISLGKLAWRALGEPDSLKVEVDRAAKVMRLSPGGPFSVSKNRAVSTKKFSDLEAGLYAPIGEGLYQFAGGSKAA